MRDIVLLTGKSESLVVLVRVWALHETDFTLASSSLSSIISPSSSPVVSTSKVVVVVFIAPSLFPTD